jgi:hypothetical protein
MKSLSKKLYKISCLILLAIITSCSDSVTNSAILRTARISEEVQIANMRSSPGYEKKDDSVDVIATIPSGSFVEIIDGPSSADGLDWWFVSWNGHEGWVSDHTGNGRVILIFE